MPPVRTRVAAMRLKYFPDADALTRRERRGCAWIPIVIRWWIRRLTLAEWRLLTYLHLRSDQNGFCFPPDEEVLADLGLKREKNFTPQLRRLEALKLIKTHKTKTSRYYLVLDPRHGLSALARRGTLSALEVAELDELLGKLGQPPLAASRPAQSS